MHYVSAVFQKANPTKQFASATTLESGDQTKNQSGQSECSAEADVLITNSEFNFYSSLFPDLAAKPTDRATHTHIQW
jgi:hypothetical protein